MAIIEETEESKRYDLAALRKTSRELCIAVIDVGWSKTTEGPIRCFSWMHALLPTNQDEFESEAMCYSAAIEALRDHLIEEFPLPRERRAA